MQYDRRFTLVSMRCCAWMLLFLISARIGSAESSDLTFVRDPGVTASDDFVDALTRRLGRDGDAARSVLAADYPGASTTVAMAQDDDDAGFEGLASSPRTRSLGTGARSSSTVEESQALRRRSDKQPIVIAVGPEALHAVMRSPQPRTVVAVLVSRSDLEATRASGSEVYAIVTDQPAQRQLQLIELAIPKPHRIGLVYPPDAEAQYVEMSAAAKRLGLKVVAQRSETAADLSSALTTVLPASDVLLLLSDPISLAPGVAQNVLRAAAAARKPVVSSTEALVRAGAVLGVYTTRDQFVDEAADSIRLLQQGGKPPSVSTPRRFSVGINPSVAQALSLSLSDQDALQRRLAAAP